LNPAKPAHPANRAPTRRGSLRNRVTSEGKNLALRVVIENIRPEVDSGRFPIKRAVGERVDVRADAFADGHDVLVAVLRHRPASQSEWRETAMTSAGVGSDEWTASFPVHEVGWHEYQIVAWVDRFLTWQRDLEKKEAAGQDVSVDLLEGSTLPIDDRSRATESPVRRVWVDRPRAASGAWYEMFPRSAGPDPNRSGTLAEAAAELPRIADLGFDVLYLPPIHPIGSSFRKGPNNSLIAGPGDLGSPWAIGSAAGGHTAVDPALGTLEDFDRFRAAAERLGLEVALDLAWQTSPDHPWVREHPAWFRHRADGTIKYAENPPKKYQDIYPFDFDSDDREGLWSALLDVTRFWVERGVRIFRVDNPHTKPLGFWEWLIEQIHADFPDVIFLSEAFTRPPLMRYLAKLGFTQSYSYFTWRNSKAELTEYFTELTATGMAEYFRANLFANTPDILHAFLQQGGRPAFEARLLLAATLGANYGIYSGFEICEARALKPGSEEYADSEKYQVRKRRWDGASSIAELIRRVNLIRHTHPALQTDRTLTFHQTDNEHIIAYSKTALDGGDRVLTVVNLDPFFTQHGFIEVPVDEAAYTVRDLLDDTDYTWHRGWNYVRFDPGVRQGHLLCLPKPRT
jgi:starch synthase (maltosyl-transferring)